MIITRIEIDGFGPHKKTDLTLKDTMTAIIGQNGAGKTFALEAVPAILFGVFPSRGGSILDHITQGLVGDCLLATEFKIGDQVFRAERKARKKIGGGASQECFLFSKTANGWSALAGPKQDDFNKEISRLVGDEKLFLSSVFSSQNMAGDIIDAKPTERKRLFGELLGLDKYEDLSRAALNKMNGIVFSLEEFSNRRAMLVEQLENETALTQLEGHCMAEKVIREVRIKNLEKELEQSKAKMAELDAQKINMADIAKKRQSLIDQGKEINTAMQSNIARQNQFKDAIAKIPELEKAQAARQDALEKQIAQAAILQANQEIAQNIRIIESQIGQEQLIIRGLEMTRDNAMAKSVADRKAKMDGLHSQKREKETTLRSLTSDTRILESGDFSFPQCKACLFTKKAFESKDQIDGCSQALAKLEADILEAQAAQAMVPLECADCDKKIAEKQIIINDLSIQAAALNGKIIILEAVSIPEDKSQTLANARAAQSNIQEWDLIIEQQRKKIEEIRAEILALPPSEMAEIEKHIAELGNMINPKTTEINRCRLENTNFDSQLGGIASKREKNIKINASIQELEIKNVQNISDRKTFEYLAKAMGRNGIQALLIDSAIPSIQAISDELLQIATDGRMRISISTQKELKGGGTSESLEIFCSDEKGVRDVQNFSGGEQKILRTILRMSLAIFQANRSDIRIKTLFIDELFDALDQSNAMALLQTLNRVSQYFERVIFISHDDSILADFDNKIELKKGNLA